MPEPPARSRSASVPCGVSSTSSSPDRYCRSNSLFSPTYDDTIRRIRLAEQQPEPPVVDAAVVRDHLELVGALLEQRVDQHRRDAAQPEAADRQTRTRSRCRRPPPPREATTLSTTDLSCRPLPGAARLRHPRACPDRSVTRRDAPCRPTHRRHRGTAVRLHIVTGKGGTGKTTVPPPWRWRWRRAASGAALRGRGPAGHRVGLRRRPAAVRGAADRHRPRDGGEVCALAIDAEAALLEYLEMYYRLGRAGKALDRFGVIDFATTIAPGLRDVLLTARSTRRRSRNRRAQERPAVRRGGAGRPADRPDRQFLNVNTEVAGIAKVGPIRNQADTVMTLLKSEQTRCTW